MSFPSPDSRLALSFVVPAEISLALVSFQTINQPRAVSGGCLCLSRGGGGGGGPVADGAAGIRGHLAVHLSHTAPLKTQPHLDLSQGCLLLTSRDTPTITYHKHLTVFKAALCKFIWKQGCPEMIRY